MFFEQKIHAPSDSTAVLDMSEAAWACHLTWHANNKVGFKSSFYMVSLWNMQREISETILF